MIPGQHPATYLWLCQVVELDFNLSCNRIKDKHALFHVNNPFFYGCQYIGLCHLFEQRPTHTTINGHIKVVVSGLCLVYNECIWTLISSCAVVVTKNKTINLRSSVHLILTGFFKKCPFCLERRRITLRQKT